jgi:serine protease 7 (enterokinase)
MLVIVSLLVDLQTSTAQNLTTLAGRCDRRTAYFYGNCRTRACLAQETTILGNSFCDVYRRFLRTPYVRCAAVLPCCVRGGLCRQTCAAGETQLAALNDCAPARRGVCCVGTNVSTTGTVPPQLPVAQRQGQCGTTTAVHGRLASGSVAPPASWPWMVRLAYLGNDPGVCAGVLVDNDTVLTVAHCVSRTPSNQLQVRVGDFDLARVESDEELVGVRNIEVNRNFVPGRRGNDFALLKLARPIHFTQNRLPICLPDPTMPLVQPPLCFVAGWGATESGQVNTQLRVSPVRLMDTAHCRAVMAGTNSTALGDDMICTEPLGRSPDGCLFDDGGMLTCMDTNNRYTLVGLVSEYSCASLPTLYTRADTYAETILSRL